VDTFNQMCSYHSCRHITERMASYVFIWDFECICGQFLYSVQRAQTAKHLETAVFQKKLALSLIKPLAQKRLANPTLPSAVRSTSHRTFPDLMSPIPAQDPQRLPAAKRCRICRLSHRNKTRFACRKCGAPVCKEHFRIICPDC